ncbi:aerolysin-like protein [Petromyzon marinus]|uniref:Aerolysin-like protein n=1 Tax=Petromyzon marinus TaxID=7757 RepID=A0AAJ7UGG3_PETMA|nr:aerolysin-like protein [Petromyzon marinus]
MPYPLAIHTCGGQGGTDFTFDGRSNGATLEKIWVWVGGWQVKCVKAWLTNGTSAQYGSPLGSHSEFVFQPGELFSSLSLWGNGAGTRLGAIKFKTSKGREFFVKMTDWGLKTEYPIDIGSGICLGIVGKGGSDIDCMGFVFINSVKRSELINVTYPTLHRELPKVQMEEIKSISYKNRGSVPQTYKVETSKTVTKTSSWSIANKLEATVSISVTAGIPDVVEVSSGFSFTVGTESTRGVENSESKTELLSFDVTVPPGKTVAIDVNIGRAEIDLPYKGTVRMTLLNGATFDIPMEGVYKGLAYTKATAETREK